MKHYNITVDGTAYDVQVEDLGETGAAVSAPAAKPAPKKAAPAPVGAQGSVKVEAPMQGLIVGIKVKVGDKIKSGDVIAVLEAMKLENDIPSPADGTVVSINVSKGENIASGAVIATLS
ncbi:acetyl-CoA carboxylase biotin carboxyl carrier protein subunit [Clostridia bacterium]|nr:acetyl-CoA carboxylase biotin carboxyl carrier protein subunit [Clostridia bacterium]